MRVKAVFLVVGLLLYTAYRGERPDCPIVRLVVVAWSAINVNHAARCVWFDSNSRNDSIESGAEGDSALGALGEIGCLGGIGAGWEYFYFSS